MEWLIGGALYIYIVILMIALCSINEESNK